MIPNIRAVVIDDIASHLNAICLAAEKAKFVFRKIHFPDGLDNSVKDDLLNQNVRLVICDLHLGAQGALAEKNQTYGTVAGVLENIGLAPWSPYVLVIWSQDAGNTELVTGLQQFLRDRLPGEYLPCSFVVLDKTDYGIPDGNPTQEQQEALWRDLANKVAESRGIKLILQWEAELQRATGKMVCNIIASARSSDNSLSLDDAIDSLMTSIAQNATSAEFAKTFPRASAAEGLLPLLSDEMQHLEIDDAEDEVWQAGMTNALTGNKAVLSAEQKVSLNSAFHVSIGGAAKTYIERGSVFSCSLEDAGTHFGLKESMLCDVFGLKSEAWPETGLLRLVQLEGACDAAQRKQGVVPLVLAAQLEDQVKIKSKGVPASVQETPSFVVNDSASQRLVANVRYFFTLPREELDKYKPLFRIRESVVTQLAFAWATHTIRPGIVSF